MHTSANAKYTLSLSLKLWLPRPKVIRDGFEFRLLWIRVSTGSLPKCSEFLLSLVSTEKSGRRAVTIPQCWRKWKSDLESVSRPASPPKFNQFFPLEPYTYMTKTVISLVKLITGRLPWYQDVSKHFNKRKERKNDPVHHPFYLQPSPSMNHSNDITCKIVYLKPVYRRRYKSRRSSKPKLH